jgi:hypothetical protein
LQVVVVEEYLEVEQQVAVDQVEEETVLQQVLQQHQDYLTQVGVEVVELFQLNQVAAVEVVLYI